MTSDLETRFEQLSPLLDDVVSRITSLSRSQTEHAVLSSLAAGHIETGTALYTIRNDKVDEPMTPEESARIIKLLQRKHGDCAEMLMLAAEKAMIGAPRQ